MNPSTKRTSPTSIAPMTRRCLRALEVPGVRLEMQIAVVVAVAAADVDPAVAEARAADVSHEQGYAECVALSYVCAICPWPHFWDCLCYGARGGSWHHPFPRSRGFALSPSHMESVLSSCCPGSFAGVCGASRCVALFMWS